MKEVTERLNVIIEFAKKSGKKEFCADEFLSGPAKYFHQEALKACKDDFLKERHIEMIYATLASWGMHQVGGGKTKMPEFDKFKANIANEENREILMGLQAKKIIDKDLNLEDVLPKLENLCFGDRSIVGSGRGTYIVSASKILAHILPDLVPPIDRSHTAKFFGCGMSSENVERNLLRNTLKLVHEFYKDEKMLDKACKVQKECNIPLPKIVDNLIISKTSKK